MQDVFRKSLPQLFASSKNESWPTFARIVKLVYRGKIYLSVSKHAKREVAWLLIAKEKHLVLDLEDAVAKGVIHAWDGGRTNSMENRYPPLLNSFSILAMASRNLRWTS